MRNFVTHTIMILGTLLPSVSYGDEIGRRLRLAIDQLDSKGLAAIEAEGQTMHQNLDAATSPKDRMLLALKLGEFYSSQNERLSLQYLALAESQISFVRPGKERETTQETITFLKSRGQFRVQSYEAALNGLMPLIRKMQRPDLEKEALEIVISAASALERHQDVIRYFEIYARKNEKYTLKDDAVACAAKSYLALGVSRKAIALMERLVDKFPFSAPSRWAFDSLETMSRDHQPVDYSFTVSLLGKIARNTSGDTVTRQRLQDQLQRPVRLSRDKAKILTGMERVQAQLILREYQLAVKDAEMIPMQTLSPLLRATLNRWMGLAQAALGNHELAAQYYNAYFSDPGIKTSKSTVTTLGQSFQKIEKYRTAAREFEALGGASGDQSLPWQQFWQVYFTHKDQDALAILKVPENIAARDPMEPRATDYWQAKIMLRKGKKAEAMEIFARIVKEESDSYYATIILSTYPKMRKLLGNTTAFRDDMNANIANQEAALAATLQKRVGLTYGEDSTDVALMAEEGETAPIKGSIKRQSLKREKLLAIYPLAFQDIVEKTTGIVNLDKYLMWSIMKAESHYNPKARSPVGARGLVQIMPFTAMQMASQMEDEGFNVDRLEAPSVNIAYGSYYLKKLMDRYRGNFFLAIAAYNAGPGAVDGWLKNCSQCSVDEFVDGIPYKETRQYVKKVIRFYSRYRALYTGEWGFPALPPMPNRLDGNTQASL